MSYHITDLERMQARIGSVGISDERTDWRRKRMQAVEYAEILREAGYDDLANRVGVCGSSLVFGVSLSKNTKKLQSANFCQTRLCPMCAYRRARKTAINLSRVMDAAEDGHGVRFIFLTLSARNCPGTELGKSISDLTAAWSRLLRQRPVRRAIVGWYRSIEVTRNGDRKSDYFGTYHPHIHAILAVMPEYFERESGLYLTQKDLLARWQQALKVDYAPKVHIEACYQRSDRADRSEVLEAAKYPTKPQDILGKRMTRAEQVQVVRDYIPALHHRRMAAYGGILKEIYASLQLPEDDNDLIHLDSDSVREDVYDLMVTYRWTMGVGDYVLTDVIPAEQVTQFQRLRRKGVPIGLVSLDDS